MLCKRIIPCLDIKNGRVVKGINYVSLRDAGDPIEVAKYYNNSLADEIVLLDITASNENRNMFFDVLKRVSKNVFIPLTVGGGIRSINDIRLALINGADKVSINTSAVKNPSLISEASLAFGSQCIVLAIDAKYNSFLSKYEVFINGGRINTNIDAVEWAKRGVELGAGEILLTSIDMDGTKNGYDCTLTKAISESVNVPVIASGGAGSHIHFFDCFSKGKADACLAASVFHYHEIEICSLKDYLRSKGLEMRRF